MNLFNNIELFPKYISKYLLKNGNPQWKLELSDDKRYSMAVIIPAIMEYENLRKLLLSLSQNDSKYFDKCIFIFVINNVVDSRIEVKQDNLHSLNLIRKIINKDTDDDLVSEVADSGLNIGLVDATTDDSQFDKKVGGVGLARKVGMDLALTVLNYDNKQRNILVCLDADCTVDSNYLTEVFESGASTPK